MTTPIVKLGGILGELPVEKTYELAKNYHFERKKVAERTLDPINQHRMSALSIHVLFGNWSDPKNAHLRLKHKTTPIGKQWKELDGVDREQAMSAYIIMVDGIHKGFGSYVDCRVQRFKIKQAKRRSEEDRKREEEVKLLHTSPMFNEKPKWIRRATSEPQHPKTIDPTPGENSCHHSDIQEYISVKDIIDDDYDSKLAEAGTVTCHECFRMASCLCSTPRNPKPLMISRYVQTNLSGENKEITDDFDDEILIYPEINKCIPRDKLEEWAKKALCKNIEEKFDTARLSLFSAIREKQAKVGYEKLISLLSMIAFVERKERPDLSEQFANQEVLYSDFQKALRNLEDKEIFEVQAEFIIEVIDICPKYANDLAEGLFDAITSNLSGISSDEDNSLESETVSSIITANTFYTGKHRKRNQKKKRNKKNKIKQQKKKVAEIVKVEEDCMDDLRKTLEEIREMFNKCNEANCSKIEEEKKKEREEAVKTHNDEHTMDYCNDTIDYFNHRIWQTFCSITPNIMSTDDILKWCRDKIITNEDIINTVDDVERKKKEMLAKGPLGLPSPEEVAAVAVIELVQHMVNKPNPLNACSSSSGSTPSTSKASERAICTAVNVFLEDDDLQPCSSKC